MSLYALYKYWLQIDILVCVTTSLPPDNAKTPSVILYKDLWSPSVFDASWLDGIHCGSGVVIVVNPISNGYNKILQAVLYVRLATIFS